MPITLPLHRLDAATLRKLARDAAAFARQAERVAAQKDEEVQARAATRARVAAALQARQEAAASRKAAMRLALAATASTAVAAASCGVSRRTAQRHRAAMARPHPTGGG